jgi:hypothetical protein
VETDGVCFGSATLTSSRRIFFTLSIQKSFCVTVIRKEIASPVLRSAISFGSRAINGIVIVGLLDDLTLKDMETRLANWLLKQCPRPISTHPVEIKLDRTKRVLAAEFGATSKTLSRTLAKFRDRKLLHVKGNTLIVTRPEQLQKLLRQHLGEF